VIVGLVVSSGMAWSETAVDLDGHARNPRAADSGTAVALVFLRRDCPVWSRYAPIIQKLSQQYANSPTFWLVYPDKTNTPRAMRQYLADYGYRLPALRDPEHSLVERSIWLDATSTGALHPRWERCWRKRANRISRCAPCNAL
jgi:hypothetical protein